MDQKTLDSFQCKEFMLSLLRDKKFENIDALVYYLNYKQDNYNEAFEEFVNIEVDWGEEVNNIDEKELSEINNY